LGRDIKDKSDKYFANSRTIVIDTHNFNPKSGMYLYFVRQVYLNMSISIPKKLMSIRRH